jgi:hypothetical protein
MRGKTLFSLMTFCLLLVTGCLPKGEVVAGNGSEVENGISGVVYLPDASVVKGAVVTLYPRDYNPFTDNESDLLQDTTDEVGRYKFIAPPSDPYNIEARFAARTLSALTTNRFADTLILSQTGSITLEGKEEIFSEVYIPGTSIRTTSGSTELSSVPSGIFSVLNRTQDTLATAIPVSTNHNTLLPNQILFADLDTYLESTEPNQNSGAKQFLRLKSGDQGLLLLHFNLDTLTSSDSATLWLTVSEFQRDFVNYSYKASVYGFTSSWEEGTGYHKDDVDDGSTYLQSAPGIPWDAGFPGTSLDSSSRIDVSFHGVRGEQIKHPFPISGKILRGLRDGTYTAIALVENSMDYNNSDFSSREGYYPPELFLYEFEKP